MRMFPSGVRRLAKRMLRRTEYPSGHFYSPIPNIAEVRRDEGRIYATTDGIERSVDIRRQQQESLIENIADYHADFKWPSTPTLGFRFYTNQTFFGRGDAAVLYALLRHTRPHRIIEVGSGFTSALMLDTRERYFEDCQLTFIDPYPERLHELLTATDLRHCTVLAKRVQEVPLTEFNKLAAGDILFVDSSHVAKVGSDVNHILFELLPLIADGVLIHFHDVFWPFEYPLTWVQAGRAWNEDYVLHAFLQYNQKFEIVLFNSYAEKVLTQLAKARFPSLLLDGPASLWLRKVGKNGSDESRDARW